MVAVGRTDGIADADGPISELIESELMRLRATLTFDVGGCPIPEGPASGDGGGGGMRMDVGCVETDG